MFSIQVGNPIVLLKPDVACEDLRDAIEEIFPMETEEALLVWSGIPILLSYKYDICILIDDLLPMLEILLRNRSGQYSICFPSNTFRVDWALQWQDGLLTIDSAWHEVNGDKSLLNENSQLNIGLPSFLAEWKSLLQKIISSLELSQVKIVNHEEFTLLRQITDDIITSLSIEISKMALSQSLTESNQIDYYDEGQIVDAEWAEGFSEGIDIGAWKYESPEKGYYDENP